MSARFLRSRRGVFLASFASCLFLLISMRSRGSGSIRSREAVAVNIDDNDKDIGADNGVIKKSGTAYLGTSDSRQLGVNATHVPAWEPRNPRSEYDCETRIPQLNGIDIEEIHEGMTSVQRRVDFGGSKVTWKHRAQRGVAVGDAVELEIALRIVSSKSPENSRAPRGPRRPFSLFGGALPSPKKTKREQAEAETARKTIPASSVKRWATLNESRVVGNHFLVYVYGPGNLTARVRDAVVASVATPSQDNPEAVFRVSFRLPRPGKYCVDVSFYGLTVGRTNPSVIHALDRRESGGTKASSESESNRDAAASATRPHCTKADLTRPDFAGDGFWTDVSVGPRVLPVWHEAHCDFRLFAQSEALRCLENQTVHFIGDSLIRQLYAGMLYVLNNTHPKDEHQSPSFWDSHSFSFQNTTIKLYSQEQGRRPTNLVELAETTDLVRPALLLPLSPRHH
jgi:hypothetical protein